jgi:hypothetical protein
MTRVLRIGPAMTRSIDSSSRFVVICFASVRAVSSAASLMTFARSAPVKPGVRRAMTARSTSFAVRAVDDDLPVEAPRAQQRRVEDVGAVRCSNEDDAAVDVESVHLDEHLVEGLLALVVTTAETGATVTTHRVDLVDEDDRRRVGLGLLEQVPDPGRADPDEHLDEVGA